MEVRPTDIIDIYPILDIAKRKNREVRKFTRAQVEKMEWIDIFSLEEASYLTEEVLQELLYYCRVPCNIVRNGNLPFIVKRLLTKDPKKLFRLGKVEVAERFAFFAKYRWDGGISLVDNQWLYISSSFIPGALGVPGAAQFAHPRKMLFGRKAHKATQIQYWLFYTPTFFLAIAAAYILNPLVADSEHGWTYIEKIWPVLSMAGYWLLKVVKYQTEYSGKQREFYNHQVLKHRYLIDVSDTKVKVETTEKKWRNQTDIQVLHNIFCEERGLKANYPYSYLTDPYEVWISAHKERLKKGGKSGMLAETTVDEGALKQQARLIASEIDPFRIRKSTVGHILSSLTFALCFNIWGHISRLLKGNTFFGYSDGRLGIAIFNLIVSTITWHVILYSGCWFYLRNLRKLDIIFNNLTLLGRPHKMRHKREEDALIDFLPLVSADNVKLFQRVLFYLICVASHMISSYMTYIVFCLILSFGGCAAFIYYSMNGLQFYLEPQIILSLFFVGVFGFLAFNYLLCILRVNQIKGALIHNSLRTWARLSTVPENKQAKIPKARLLKMRKCQKELILLIQRHGTFNEKMTKSESKAFGYFDIGPIFFSIINTVIVASVVVGIVFGALNYSPSISITNSTNVTNASNISNASLL